MEGDMTLGLWFSLSLPTKGKYARDRHKEPRDSHLSFLSRLALGLRDK